MGAIVGIVIGVILFLVAVVIVVVFLVHKANADKRQQQNLRDNSYLHIDQRDNEAANTNLSRHSQDGGGGQDDEEREMINDDLANEDTGPIIRHGNGTYQYQVNQSQQQQPRPTSSSLGVDVGPPPQRGRESYKMAMADDQRTSTYPIV